METGDHVSIFSQSRCVLPMAKVCLPQSVSLSTHPMEAFVFRFAVIDVTQVPEYTLSRGQA